MTATSTNARAQFLIAPREAITAAAILLASAVGLLGATLDTLDRPSRAAVWGGLALAAYAAGLLCLVGAQLGKGLGLACWRLAPWTLLWYSVAFGLVTTAWSDPQTGQIAVSSVLRALWLIAVGMTAWVVGYFAGPGQPVRNLAARGMAVLCKRYAPEVRSPIAPWILYAIGITARIAGTATSGRLGYVGDTASAVSTATGYGQILTALSLCAPLAVAAAAMQVFRERLPGARITLTCLFVTELTFCLASGVKGSVITLVLAVAVPFSAVRHRLPKAALVLAVVGFLVVVVPFSLTYRSAARGGITALTASQAIDMAPGLLVQTVPAQNLASALPTVEYLLQRIREIDSSAIILQRTPAQIGFVNPVQLIEGPLAGSVPRAIWPGKPILATGYQISQEYYGFPSTEYTSSATSQAADLYRYGGWIPVISGMFLLGCGVRLLDEVLDVRAHPHSMFLLLLLWSGLVRNEAGWIMLLAGLPSTLAVWLLAVACTFRVRRST